MEDNQIVQVISNLFTRAGQYPSENFHDPEHLFRWGEILKSLSNTLEAYHDHDFEEKFARVQQELTAISRYRYSDRDRYVYEGYEICHQWLAAIAFLVDTLGLMVPHNLEFTEGGDDGL